MLGLGAATIAYLGRPAPAVTETLPVPNGFPVILQVETEWPTSPKRAVEPSAEERERRQTQQRELLTRLREGLAQEAQIPLATVREVFHTPPSSATKTLVIDLLEMAEAELDAGRSGAATQLWKDAVRLGAPRARGGVVIHFLIALAVEKRTLESISAHLDRLSVTDRRELAQTLRSIDSKWEQPSVVFARDLAVALEETPPKQRFGQRLVARFNTGIKTATEKTTQKFQAAARQRAALVQELGR